MRRRGPRGEPKYSVERTRGIAWDDVTEAKPRKYVVDDRASACPRNFLTTTHLDSIMELLVFHNPSIVAMYTITIMTTFHQ